MQTECTPALFEFEPVERKKVVAGFDGGTITSDAGALLLGRLDRGLGLIRRMAACFTDRRDPRLLEHTVETLVGQRVFGLALGYEDLNDHDELRHDPLFHVLAGKLEANHSDCAPVAGKSTLNRLEHTPKGAAAKYHKIDHDPARVAALFVEILLDAHNRPPRWIEDHMLDLDATGGVGAPGAAIHGQQEAWLLPRLTMTATGRIDVAAVLGSGHHFDPAIVSCWRVEGSGRPLRTLGGADGAVALARWRAVVGQIRALVAPSSRRPSSHCAASGDGDSVKFHR